MAAKSAFQQQQLLTAAQEGDRELVAALAEAFAATQDPGDFGRLAHLKSGDGLVHVLARGGHVPCLTFLLEEYSGRQHVDIEIRWVVGFSIFPKK